MGLSLWHLFKVSAKKELLIFYRRRRGFLNFPFEIIISMPLLASWSSSVGPLGSQFPFNSESSKISCQVWFGWFTARPCFWKCHEGPSRGTVTRGAISQGMFLSYLARSKRKNQESVVALKVENLSILYVSSFYDDVAVTSFVQVPVIIANIIVIIFEILIGG